MVAFPPRCVGRYAARVLADLQRVLLRALRHPDPTAALRAQLARGDCPLTAEERAWLAAVGDDGLRLTRLLVRKLRLQRLLRGDASVAAAMAADPVTFARQFASYDAAVPLSAVTPAEEAEAFRSYRA